MTRELNCTRCGTAFVTRKASPVRYCSAGCQIEARREQVAEYKRRRRAKEER